VKRLQCKDIPDVPILQMLAGASIAMTYRSESFPCVLDAMPEGVPERLMWAKMARLMKRRLVDGCDCGDCSGKWSITSRGHGFLLERGLQPQDLVPKVVTEVFHFVNGMTMVFDQFGNQMPHLQGRTDVVMPALWAMGFDGITAELQMSTNMEDYA
jgi:hypothetical protein